MIPHFDLLVALPPDLVQKSVSAMDLAFQEKLNIHPLLDPLGCVFLRHPVPPTTTSHDRVPGLRGF